MFKIKREKTIQLRNTYKTVIRLLALVWDLDHWLFLITLFAILVPAIIPFVNAYLFKLIIDTIVSAATTHLFDYTQLFTLVGFLTLTGYLTRVSFSLQNYATNNLYNKIPIRLYELILNRLSTLDLNFFENSDFRDILQKVRESYARPQNVVYNVFFLIQSSVQVLIALVAIIKLNALLTVLIIVVSIPDLLNQIYFSKASWSIWNRRTPHRKKFDYLVNLLQGRESVKESRIFQTFPRFITEVKEVQTEFFEENKKVAKRQLTTDSLFNLLDAGVNFGILIFIVLQAVARKITVGDISFYQSVVNNFNNGVGGAFQNLNRIFDESQYAESIFTLLDIEPVIVSPPKAKKLDINKPKRIEFRHVEFAYPGTKKKIFNDFSLIINPGEKVAFVGENGAGKTTLVKLLARFYDVDRGEILIDGINIKELDLDNWHKCLGVLFQDFIKYEYPAKDNIFFGRIWEQENLEKIIEAAKSAGADPMIKKFDSEYNQMLGTTFERGLELSGGQWQKIALARAFFRNAPILILDEPTASIDAKAESEIFQRVERLSKDKTVIIISHRFSTVRNADMIYVIDNGKIVEQGSHQELMKKGGQYYNLFTLQAKGYQ